MILVLLVFVIAGALFWFDRICKRKLKLVEDIPGPKVYPILGNSLSILYKKPEELFIFLRAMAKKYPKIYRLQGLNKTVVCLLDPDDVEVLLSSMKHIQKSLIYEYLRPWLGEGLLTTFGSKWQNRRKILTPAFHFNILQQFVAVFQEHSKTVVDKMRLDNNNCETSITPIITEFALQSVCETAMGTNLDRIPGSQPYKNAIHRMGELLVHRLVRPWLMIDRMFNLTKEGQEQVKILNDLHSFTRRVISDRRKSHMKLEQVRNDEEIVLSKGNKRMAMLDLLLSAHSLGQIDDDGIREEVDTFMFEGHDTSSMAMVYALACLANHPKIQERVYQEVFEVFGTSDRTVTMEDLNQLRYLEQCIKESLRLFPSVPFISRVLTQPLQLKNHTLPAGAIIHIHIYDIHRNPEIYQDPDRFDPDRFLPENCAERHPFAYIPFSAGPRNCIGQKFAMLEMKSMISTILRNFVMEPVTKPENIVFYSDLLLRSRDPVKITFRARN